MLETIRKELRKLGNKEKAKDLQRFFKTGPGEYGEGDKFLGIRVPETRKLAKRYKDISIKDAGRLLASTIHEERLLALVILVNKSLKGEHFEKKRIYQLYLCNTKYVNNWDLVDASAEHIVGAFLMDKSRKPLYRLVQSNNMWERRISIMSTFHFIKQGEFAETLKLSDLLLLDEEDLIHKAVGWMLREIGKRNLPAEERFLRSRYRKMPRTMLRYAIEKFPESKRQRYLKGSI